MDKRIVFGIIIFAVIIIGLFTILRLEVPGDPYCGSQECMVLRTINNLEKRIEYTYFHEEGFREEFVLSFNKDFKLCFFNSSNPSETATWNPEMPTKYLINQSGFNVWYYRGEDDNGGKGEIISHLEIPTEKNFCTQGGSKVYIVSKSYGVEIEPF
ncbi:MAG: hypothetical protein NTY20_02980 [Candidatus Aenigmarchaeota archaeon]|nr:hypothetical protein [Candidatus Aenigmarchaeota archaeon]